jgi:hypothetical protein
MSTKDKQSLQNRLANILNVSADDDQDYIIDVLNQLIEIGDAPDDVAEYLSSFVVGDEDGEDLQGFAQDVKKFKLGDAAVGGDGDETIVSEDVLTASSATAVSSATATTTPRILDEGAAKREEIKRREIEARDKQREEQERAKEKKEEVEEEERRFRELAATTTKRTESKWGGTDAAKYFGDKTKGKGGKGSSSTRKQTVETSQSATSKREQKQPTEKDAAAKKQPSMKPKGRATMICGCFGNKHNPLTNCLHCGRISCEREGYGYCPFCENLIENHTTTISNSALAHKERLLEFDRTSAARTHIHDDQEDYFVTSTNMWSTNEEQEDAREMEEARQKKLHQRQKQVLDINF